MKNYYLNLIVLFLLASSVSAQNHTANNPIIYADIPDMSIIRVGDAYYMSSTTMHMSPGVPIMKSNDLVNWKIINYCYDTLADVDALNLNHGKNAYGGGSWASCLRYHDSTFYVSTFSGTTGTTYIYSTNDIENGTWAVKKFMPSYHDNSIFFDDDGRIFMIYGGGKIMIVELKDDLSGIKEGTEQVLIENASFLTEPIMLPAEGSQLFKINGKYYVFNISWPLGGMRTVLIHRSDKIAGPWEGRIALQDKGVAQGGLIDMPDGTWYSYLFRDFGAIGRIPYLVPVKWENGWPVLGNDGVVPETLDLPVNKSLIPGVVASDEFNRNSGDADLPQVWQWNHNPDNEFWSVKKREGHLRLTTGRVDSNFLQARNTLTQRTIGPECIGSTALDVSNMKEGDFAGLALLQKKYGFVGVRFENGTKKITMISAQSDKPEEIESIPLEHEKVYLKVVCDFNNQNDIADFYFSIDGTKWTRIGSSLKMTYTLPHFMGYRFGLFNYSTKTAGGFVDFDYFHIDDKITE